MTRRLAMPGAAWLLLMLALRLGAEASSRESCYSEAEVEASEESLLEELDVQLLQTSTHMQSRGGKASAHAAKARGLQLQPEGAAPNATQNATPNATPVDKLQNLTSQAQNVTDSLHSKAHDVEHITETLANSEEELRSTNKITSDLALRYANAHAEAVNASQVLKAYLARLDAATKRRDDLRNQTEELKGKLALLAPALSQAEDDLQGLLQEMPWLEGVANTTNLTDADVGRELEKVSNDGKLQKAELEDKHAALQAAIHELNELNAQLKSIQKQMGKESGSKSAGLRRASPAAAVAAVLTVMASVAASRS